ITYVLFNSLCFNTTITKHDHISDDTIATINERATKDPRKALSVPLPELLAGKSFENTKNAAIWLAFISERYNHPGKTVTSSHLRLFALSRFYFYNTQSPNCTPLLAAWVWQELVVAELYKSPDCQSFTIIKFNKKYVNGKLFYDFYRPGVKKQDLLDTYLEGLHVRVPDSTPKSLTEALRWVRPDDANLWPKATGALAADLHIGRKWILWQGGVFLPDRIISHSFTTLKDYEGSLENPLTSLRNNWKTTMVDSLRSGQGVLPPVQSGSQSPYLNSMFLGPDKTDKPDVMWVKNFAHRKKTGRLPLQKPGETDNVDDTKCRDAPLICYSRGVVSK
ncbi:MAG: hypothetical protein LQ341_006592, partial [Variospora aurantia]